MKKQYLLFAICSLSVIGAANAAIPYRVAQNGPINGEVDYSESFAQQHRFYVGAGYNLSFWQDGADANVSVHGDSNSSFEAVAGVRVFDTFRLEANYYNVQADWDAFSLSGNAVFVNAIFDARIDQLYRVFFKQSLVPYVGFGAGVSWNSVDGTEIQNDVSPVAAAMAGLAIEMGEYFSVDLGYRYVYMFSPKFDAITDFAPTAHQFRAGVRVNF